MIALSLLLVLLVAILPLGWLRGPAETLLSRKLGRAVGVGSVARVDPISFSPRIALRDVRVGQPAWAGPGDMVRLRAATVRLPLIPALFGRTDIREVMLDGLRLALVHDAGERANWKSDEPDGQGRGDSTLERVTIRDATVTLRDARRGLALAGTLAADDQGFRFVARGSHRKAPASFTLSGSPIRSHGSWPFHAAFASPLARLSLDATAKDPLDFGHFTGAGRASGDDLKSIDDIVQAGLLNTQAIRMTGTVRHDGDSWSIEDLTGTVGRSDFAGALTVARQGGRSAVDGKLAFGQLDFDDITSDAGLARGAAERARIGPRLIPATKIDLAKLIRTDIRADVSARRLVSDHQSALKSFAGTFVLDHSRLVAEPLVVGLTHGRLRGRAVVDQRSGRPIFATDAAIEGARLEDIIRGGKIDGPLTGRIVLAGAGGTIRDALARSDGRVVLSGRGGSVDRAVAEVLGRNAGAALGAVLGAGDARTPLRCLGMRFVARQGVLTPNIFIVDTGVTRAEGEGTIRLDGEHVALTLKGQSRHPSIMRLPAPVQVVGPLTGPTVQTAYAGPDATRTILKTLGSSVSRLFGGEKHDRAPPPPPPVDCEALLASLR